MNGMRAERIMQPTLLSKDGRFIRVDSPWWSFYIDAELAPKLEVHECGKWMFFFTDVEFAETICRKAVLEEAVAECKHRSSKSLTKNESGVACLYLNSNDDEAHRRVISFMLKNNLIRKTKSGRLYNIGFKRDDQTRACEYGSNFKAQIKLADFVDLDTGELL